EALRRVGLEDRAGHRPGQLSGGEQQRTALARAIVHNPPLLLADEPTGNLDRATAEEVIGLVRRTCDELGTTVVMVTHDEETAGRVADRIVHLRDGRLLAEGAPP
ncbi:MAG TPA: ATP-binding cassette domain-containing protein, partial [Phycisphaerae bacterium]|nr:ATP-binding cassette domain-containing protein [Phycisphaerae bacterium]